MRIVFMGTPEFAVPSLSALHAAGYEVVAACTQPDRQKGRGKKMVACPVKERALALSIPVLQFERIRTPEGIAALEALSPDLFVTAAFGQILSQKLLDIPRLGTVNVHASLLPAYRGPAPINWCIMEGEAQAGVTTMMTDAGIDTGDMLMARAVDIGDTETAGELTERLSHVGAELLIETLAAMEDGMLRRTPQDHAAATRHPMLTKDTGRIDWTQDAKRIACLVRGVDPWPGAHTHLPDGGTLKIWAADVLDDDSGAAPGTVLYADAKRGMAVACGTGALRILSLQAPGAKRMAATDYLRGHPMGADIRLGTY